MRHSSRILQIFAILAVIPPTAFAGGAGMRGPSVGSARGLSPIRPIVGLARGVSPVRPVVGSARGLPTTRFDSEARRRIATAGIRHPFRQRNIAGGSGDVGFAGAGLFGTGLAYAADPYSPRPEDLGEDNPQVLLAPPPPCVRPQIISVGRSVHVERQAAKRAGVRVVYGRPSCGTF